MAFHVNNSPGTAHMIACMRALGTPVVVIQVEAGLKARGLARVQAHREFASLATAHDLCLNPLCVKESNMSTTVSHPNPTAQAHAIADLTGYEDAATLRWQQACVQAANTLTALPNGRYVNVRMERMRQGLELAQRGVVTLPEDGEELSAVVRSDTVYQVDTRLLTCTCADYQKHLQAASICSPWIHTGALGLAGRAKAAHLWRRSQPAPQPATRGPCTATWPISEAPASLNIKLKIGNMELMLVRPVQTELAHVS